MVTCLVGHTGFVGSNLAKKNDFTYQFNSKNIEEAFGLCPDLLIYSGVRAEKYLANQFPEKDYEIVKIAFENIKKINAKQVVLISTIDIYSNPVGVDEDFSIDINNLQPYGLNRYYLEQWVEKEYDNSIIIRLPGLFGANIKKNFIYDMIYIIPNMLKESKYEELCNIDSLIEKYYINQRNGFYKCKELSRDERYLLVNYFNEIGFSALNFTDSRGSFQFYNLDYLWPHINIALKKGIRKFNLATEPVTVSEVYQYIRGYNFQNEIASIIPQYDFRTKHSETFHGNNNYIFSKDKVLMDIKEFVEGYKI